MIWKRTFDFPVRFDCFGDEKILKSQYEIFDRFSLNPQWIEEARSDIERYCSKLVRDDKYDMTNTIKIVEKDELDAYDDDEEDEKDDGVDETTKSYFSFAFGKNSLQD